MHSGRLAAYAVPLYFSVTTSRRYLPERCESGGTSPIRGDALRVTLEGAVAGAESALGITPLHALRSARQVHLGGGTVTEVQTRNLLAFPGMFRSQIRTLQDCHYGVLKDCLQGPRSASADTLP